MKTAMEAYYTACAVEAVHEDVEPIVVIGVSYQDAQEKLENAVAERCKETDSDIDLWITYAPREHTLPAAPLSPEIPFDWEKGLPKSMARDILDGAYDMMSDCWKDYVNQVLPEDMEGLLEDVFGAYNMHETVDQYTRKIKGGGTPTKKELRDLKAQARWMLPHMEKAIKNDEALGDVFGDDLKAMTKRFRRFISK